jgi:hypothetical protein
MSPASPLAKIDAFARVGVDPLGDPLMETRWWATRRVAFRSVDGLGGNAL